MIAVLDTGVVVSGIFWRNEPHRCLVALAKRQFTLAVTEPVLDEYVSTVWDVKVEEEMALNPEPWLQWLASRARFVTPSPLPKQTCRDAKDDKFLACALAASATLIVSRDQDLLVLEKPFGIEIITPRQFLGRLG
jgi:putative PIN family toxin of toxin-antitoxin system